MKDRVKRCRDCVSYCDYFPGKCLQVSINYGEEKTLNRDANKCKYYKRKWWKLFAVK